jgi:TPR repeat protein
VNRKTKADAEAALGELYYFGVNQCKRKAYAFLSSAAKSGHSKAQYLLGLYYLDIQMYVIAEELFTKSAKQGYSPAIFALCDRGWKGPQEFAADVNR